MAEPPANAVPLLAESLNRLSQASGAADQVTRVADPKRLAATLPHNVYLLGADAIAAGRDLTAARLCAWRFLVVYGQVVLAAIELHCDRRGAGLSFGSLDTGPFALATQRAVASAEKMPQVRRGSYEVRVLKAPSVYAMALWLKNLRGPDDIVVPLAATVDSTTAQSLGGAAPMAGPGDFLAGLRSAARKALRSNTAPPKPVAGAAGDQLLGGAAADDSGLWELPVETPEEAPPPPAPAPTLPALSSPLPPPRPVPVPAPAATPKPVPKPPAAPKPPTAPGASLPPGPSLPAPTGPSATGGHFNRQPFIKSYAALVARTWADDVYLETLLAAPAPTLHKAGLDTLPGAVIRIVQLKMTGMGQIEEQVDAWIAGRRNGLYDLYLPLRPDDLDVSAGMAADAGNSCCCTPCCCCT